MKERWLSQNLGSSASLLVGKSGESLLSDRDWVQPYLIEHSGKAIARIMQHFRILFVISAPSAPM